MYDDERRTGGARDDWQRIQDAKDESRLCSSCDHPVFRHYSSAAGIERLCGLCGCTNWSKTPEGTMDWLRGA
ncbi:hypothetical protein Ade02nite_20760 [Paractinoplanes deccanensis]|uniref:Uncharacterized protein n=1 Tax=Paractinoplanes deccanensis TaxID=113561 RepID=A0ABQ3Y0C9_9ACTN|nr:hypothetical protein [Actinoplanes deccanensis]GID73435.1 hypothetical protein Ade02nite_20760 [Actinoplanes deccanensis]